MTHTLTHNRKSAGGRSGLRIKQNRHFPSHAAPIGLEVTLFFSKVISGPRGRVFKSHHSDQYKCPETVYSCGFRAFLFICGFRYFSAVTHTVTHTGFGRVIFGCLVCSLFYAAAILLRSALYARLDFLAPTVVQKCPTLAF